MVDEQPPPRSSEHVAAALAVEHAHLAGAMAAQCDYRAGITVYTVQVESDAYVKAVLWVVENLPLDGPPAWVLRDMFCHGYWQYFCRRDAHMPTGLAGEEGAT